MSWALHHHASINSSGCAHSPQNLMHTPHACAPLSRFCRRAACRGEAQYEETCEASFKVSAVEDAQCIATRNLLEADCADAWGTWLGLQSADVATMAGLAEAIHEGCSAITTEVCAWSFFGMALLASMLFHAF